MIPEHAMESHARSAVLERSVSYGSRKWEEDRFVASMEDCSYPKEQFKHGDHIRLAWIYLRRYGLQQSEQRIATTIRRFAISLGHEEKFHQTITLAWLLLVNAAYAATPEIASFDEFLANHAWLLSRGALAPFYSQNCLSSGAARHGWVEPDRRTLPNDSLSPSHLK